LPERYRHNRTGEDNADAHLIRQVMGREFVVAVTAGKLDFGPWEQIFLRRIRRATSKSRVGEGDWGSKIGYKLRVIFREGVQMSERKSYLLTWNENKKPWADILDVVRKTKLGEKIEDWWNVSSSHIVPGDRLFILKTGREEPRGIMGSGIARSNSSGTRQHWDKDRAVAGETVRFVDSEWDVILDPKSERLLTEDRIRTPELSGRLWNPQSSGNEIESDVAVRIEDEWNVHVGKLRGFSTVDVSIGDADEESFPEGREL
jgi:hypothetical protein